MILIKMLLTKHTNLIYQYDNVISKEECDSIIDASRNFDWNQIKNNSYNRNKKNSSINLTKNRSNYLAQQIDDLANYYIGMCNVSYLTDNKIVNHVLGKLGVLKFKSEYMLRKYNTYDDYDWHMDYGHNKTYLLSYLLYLNDNFDGGKTLFMNQKISVSPKQGSVLCFPCGLETIHKSTKIIQGSKYVIWSCFDALNQNR